MSITTSTVSCGLSSLKPSLSDLSNSRHNKPNGCSFPANRSNFQYLTTGRTSHTGNRSKITEFIVYNGDPAAGGDLFPFGDLLDHWKYWTPGVLLTVIVPFFTNKWGPFAKLKEEIDKVEETVDHIADVVEEVAEKVEEVVDDIADDLPESSKLRNALNYVENVAKEVAKDAQLIEDAVAKMDEMEAKVETIANTMRGNGTDKSNVTAKVE